MPRLLEAVSRPAGPPNPRTKVRGFRRGPGFETDSSNRDSLAGASGSFHAVSGILLMRLEVIFGRPGDRFRPALYTAAFAAQRATALHPRLVPRLSGRSA